MEVEVWAATTLAQPLAAITDRVRALRRRAFLGPAPAGEAVCTEHRRRFEDGIRDDDVPAVGA